MSRRRALPPAQVPGWEMRRGGPTTSIPYRSPTGPSTSGAGTARSAGGVSDVAGMPSSSAKCSNPAGAANTSTRGLDVDRERVWTPHGRQDERAARGYQRLLVDVERHLPVQDVPGLVLAMVDVQRGLGRSKGQRLDDREAAVREQVIEFDRETSPERPDRRALTGSVEHGTTIDLAPALLALSSGFAFRTSRSRPVSPVPARYRHLRSMGNHHRPVDARRTATHARSDPVVREQHRRGRGEEPAIGVLVTPLTSSLRITTDRFSSRPSTRHRLRVAIRTGGSRSRSLSAEGAGHGVARERPGSPKSHVEGR